MIAIRSIPSPQVVQVFAGPRRSNGLPIVEAVAVGVRLAVVSARVGLHICRLGKLVFEQNGIGIKGTALA
jgi:hypothetical protein